MPRGSVKYGGQLSKIKMADAEFDLRGKGLQAKALPCSHPTCEFTNTVGRMLPELGDYTPSQKTFGEKETIKVLGGMPPCIMGPRVPRDGRVKTMMWLLHGLSRLLYEPLRVEAANRHTDGAAITKDRIRQRLRVHVDTLTCAFLTGTWKHTGMANLGVDHIDYIAIFSLPEMAGKKYIFPDLQTWLDGGKYWCHTYQGTSFEGPMNGVVQQEDVAAWVEQSREEMGIEGPILGQSDDPIDGDWD